MMMGTSRLFKAVTKYWPTPGITKMFSMKIEPVMPNAKVTGKEVMMGIEALRTMWCNTICDSDSPFARAVMTYSLEATSTIEFFKRRA